LHTLEDTAFNFRQFHPFIADLKSASLVEYLKKQKKFLH